jgi:outer membrane protein TolC
MKSSVPNYSKPSAGQCLLHWLVLAVLMFVPVSFAQPAVFSLTDALSKLDQSPILRQAVSVYRQTQADLAVARAKAGLQVRLDTKGNNDLTLLNGTNTLTVNLQLGLSLPIALQSAPLQAVQIAELALKSAEAQLRLIRSNLAWRVVRAYAQVLSADQGREQTQLKLELAQNQSRAFAERVRLGTATELDALNAQLVVGNTQLDLARAEFAVRDARFTLAGLIGRGDLPGGLRLPDAPPALPKLERLNVLVPQAPSVVFAQVNLELARLNAQLAELQAFPSLRLELGVVANPVSAGASLALPDLIAQANVNYQVFGLSNASVPIFSLTLSASLPVWDGGAAGASRDSANRNIERTTVELEQAYQDVRAQLINTLELVQLDDQNLLTQRAALEVAQKSLETIQARFKAGSVTSLEVLTVRVQLSMSEGTLLSTQLRALEDRFQLYALLGVGGLS